MNTVHCEKVHFFSLKASVNNEEFGFHCCQKVSSAISSKQNFAIWPKTPMAFWVKI